MNSVFSKRNNLILCFSFSSCQYRFVYFFLVYPMPNLELCESLALCFFALLFTWIEMNSVAYLSHFSTVFSVVRWFLSSCVWTVAQHCRVSLWLSSFLFSLIQGNLSLWIYLCLQNCTWCKDIMLIFTELLITAYSLCNFSFLFAEESQERLLFLNFVTRLYVVSLAIHWKRVRGNNYNFVNIWDISMNFCQENCPVKICSLKA